MNKELAEERSVARFNQSALTAYLYGGEENVKRRREIAEYVEKIREFDNPKDPVFMTREERIENTLRKTLAMVNHIHIVDFASQDEVDYFRRLVLGSDTASAELHYTMFLPAIRGQCSDEQQEKWLSLALSLSVFGTYAQTELGHGTNLKRLETTAEYDQSTQEFIINTPTLTATKWWPGNLGKMSNYAVVMAQLHTKGASRGVHGFLVPLRDPDTHQPLPGITIGDIGPKFGIPTNDNGFLRLDKVRVPRENMLMRFARVEPDGTYIPPNHDKLSYGTMIFIRAAITSDQAWALARACTIAVRYSCVRRQGEKEDGSGEVKLLDYKTQQYRLLPELAKSFALRFAGGYMNVLYGRVNKMVSRGDTSSLPDLHALSCGLKAVASWDVAQGIEICRLSCGGHGYLLASGLPELYTTSVGACTYEGDNIVLLLQTARALMKLVRNGNIANDVNDSVVAYILQKPASNESPLDPRLLLDHVHEAYKHVARRLIYECAELLASYESRGYSGPDAWDRCSIQLTQCAKAHVRVFIVSEFIDAVNQAPSDQPSVKHVLLLLCQLYSFCGILDRAGSFLEDAYLSKQQMHYVRQRMVQLLAELRPMAVQLVDSFQFRDRELNSVLGRYDGNVYENLYKWATESPLNQKQVLDCVKEHLLPVTREAKSKL